jgi:thiol-disulfide isomerase/thioredoxin
MLPCLFAAGAHEVVAPQSKDPIDQELAALAALQLQEPPAGSKGASHYKWFDQHCQEIGRSAFAILEKYPQDPRRWNAALVLQQRRFHPRFVKSIDDNYAQVEEQAVHRDTGAEKAWSDKVDVVEKALRSASDVPDEVREKLDFSDMMQTIIPYFEAAHNKTPMDIGPLQKTIETFFARWPMSESGRGLLPMFVNLSVSLGHKDEASVLAAFAESPNEPAREYVKTRIRFLALSKEPFELSFTALDGRKVDLKALRGKVVLIDFWATWCGPCIAELPNVKQTYAAYHDKGFEVIGVSLDNERDRKKFIDLVAKEGIAWPQRFEGKGWEDSLAKEYTVSGIPAMFLLDQQGRLVTTDARGEKLGLEIKRLLKL